MFGAAYSSQKGYRHEKEGLPCQDASYADAQPDFAIAIVSDGHGSPIYFRSHLGAQFAIQALYQFFLRVYYFNLLPDLLETNFHFLKINVLAMWNGLVENHFQLNPFSEPELSGLSDTEKLRVKSDFYLAYGATLNGSILTKEFLLSVQIGDGITTCIDHDLLAHPLFIQEDEEGGIANQTHSLCQSKAYDFIHCHYQKPPIFGVVHGTDGLLNPFQTMDNFLKRAPESVIQQMVHPSSADTKAKPLHELVNQLATSKGNGDDVSMAAVWLNGTQEPSRETPPPPFVADQNKEMKYHEST